jgi:hypothetical protein
MNMRLKIIILVLVLALSPLVKAQNNTTDTIIYYCTTYQNPNNFTFYCIQNGTDFDKNNISNALSHNYTQAINFLEAGKNSTYINQTIANMTNIENFSGNATLSQLQASVKQEATAIKWLYQKIGNLLLYIEWLYKFDKFVYGLIT